MRLGCIADDVTGASGLADTLAKGGMATVQYIGVPSSDRPVDREAGVVALKTRSIPPGEAVTQSFAAREWLRAQGCRQFKSSTARRSIRRRRPRRSQFSQLRPGQSAKRRAKPPERSGIHDRASIQTLPEAPSTPFRRRLYT
jgi:hypothetical protein